MFKRHLHAFLKRWEWLFHCIIIFSPVVVSCWLPALVMQLFWNVLEDLNFLAQTLTISVCVCVCQGEVVLGREEGERLKVNSVIESVSIIIQKDEVPLGIIGLWLLKCCLNRASFRDKVLLFSLMMFSSTKQQPSKVASVQICLDNCLCFMDFKTLPWTLSCSILTGTCLGLEKLWDLLKVTQLVDKLDVSKRSYLVPFQVVFFKYLFSLDLELAGWAFCKGRANARQGGCWQ